MAHSVSGRARDAISRRPSRIRSRRQLPAPRAKHTTPPIRPRVSTSTPTRKQGGTVTISNEQGQTWPCQFNPFNPANNAESLGFVYEPLVFVDVLNNQAETPMLASRATRGAPDKKSIDFTIRDGVKWSDGQPFTAEDVAFTFNLMKTDPGARPRTRCGPAPACRASPPTATRSTMTFASAGQGLLLQLRQPGRHRARAHLVDR